MVLSGGSSGFHLHKGSFGFPVVADLGEDGARASQLGGIVRDERADSGTAFDHLIQPHEPVGRLEPQPVRGTFVDGSAPGRIASSQPTS